MPPRQTGHPLASISYHEGRLDEITKLMRNFVELKSGFGEAHVLSRTLQNIVKQFDLDHSGQLSTVEFGKTLDFMNIKVTPDELAGLFERFDVDHSGTLSQKEFGDAVVGISDKAPGANLDVRAVFRKVQDKLLARAKANHNDNEVLGLTRSLVLMDRNGSNTLSKEELFNGLQRYGVPVTLADVDLLLRHFDRNRSRDISITEFLRGLRGHMPKRRQELVLQAFKLMDRNGNGTISLEEVRSLYDVSRHPQVLSGDKTKDQVLQDFMLQWTNDKTRDGNITWREWFDYYSDISAGIDLDDYFELMMRNVWHISGGSGASENTSCRRVLVTYTDGHQTIEEIKNDLGIRKDDKKAMIANLEQQGITNVSKVELYH